MRNKLRPNRRDLFRYRHRKFPVSQAFLDRNWWNAKRFILYAQTAHGVIRTYAWRRRKTDRVFLVQRMRSRLLNPRLKKMTKRRLGNVRLWSKLLREKKDRTSWESEDEEASEQTNEQLQPVRIDEREIVAMENPSCILPENNISLKAKRRMINELRRLNTTIVDASAIKPDDVTVDLHHRANVRLAKVEKDFTSTLVLANNDMLLFNESENRRRQCTKGPKKYVDFDDTKENVASVVWPSSKRQKMSVGAPAPTAPPLTKPKHCSVSLRQVTDIVNSATFCPDTDLVQPKHCSVSLRPQTDVNNSATLCPDLPEDQPVAIEQEPEEATTFSNPEVDTRVQNTFEGQSEEVKYDQPDPYQNMIQNCVIPVPIEGFVCLCQWKYFLNSLKLNKIFIWSVHMATNDFMAVTTINVPPPVCEAISAIDIRYAIDQDALPLLAVQLLRRAWQNDNTNRHVVVMQAMQGYWHINPLKGDISQKLMSQMSPLSLIHIDQVEKMSPNWALPMPEEPPEMLEIIDTESCSEPEPMSAFSMIHIDKLEEMLVPEEADTESCSEPEQISPFSMIHIEKKLEEMSLTLPVPEKPSQMLEHSDTESAKFDIDQFDEMSQMLEQTDAGSCLEPNPEPESTAPPTIALDDIILYSTIREELSLALQENGLEDVEEQIPEVEIYNQPKARNVEMDKQIPDMSSRPAETVDPPVSPSEDAPPMVIPDKPVIISVEYLPPLITIPEWWAHPPPAKISHLSTNKLPTSGNTETIEAIPITNIDSNKNQDGVKIDSKSANSVTVSRNPKIPEIQAENINPKSCIPAQSVTMRGNYNKIIKRVPSLGRIQPRQDQTAGVCNIIHVDLIPPASANPSETQKLPSNVQVKIPAQSVTMPRNTSLGRIQPRQDQSAGVQVTGNIIHVDPIPPASTNASKNQKLPRNEFVKIGSKRDFSGILKQQNLNTLSAPMKPPGSASFIPRKLAPPMSAPVCQPQQPILGAPRKVRKIYPRPNMPVESQSWQNQMRPNPLIPATCVAYSRISLTTGRTLPMQAQSLGTSVTRRPSLGVRLDQATASSLASIPWPQNNVPCFGSVYAENLPSYPARVQGSHIIIKIPNVEGLLFKSLEDLNSFLNCYLAGMPEYEGLLPAKWNFLLDK